MAATTRFALLSPRPLASEALALTEVQDQEAAFRRLAHTRLNMRDGSFIGVRSFPRLLQNDDWSCASRSAQAVLQFFGITRPHWLLRSQLQTNPQSGTTVSQMIRVLRRHGCRVGYRPNLGWRELVQALKAGAVGVVHLDGDHIGVVQEHAMMAYKFCMRCSQLRPYNEGCKTPECVELQKSPTYLRNELEDRLHIAKTLLAEGNTEEDWPAAVKELETELMLLDQHRGSAAFKQ